MKNEIEKKEIGLQRKNRFMVNRSFATAIIIVLGLSGLNSCKDDDDNNNNNSGGGGGTGYKQVNEVADISIYNPVRTDANLVNPWGIAIGPTGYIWLSANGTDKTTIYDRTGAEILPAISLQAGSAPTGVVYNSNSASFMGSKFIYCGEDGKIATWTTGTTTAVVADRSGMGAVYKGLAIANDGGADFLYVANFKGNDIDVFDANFNYITTKPFTDDSIPGGFAPFNIYNHDGKLYVAYAKQLAPDNEDDESGPGNGFINVFNADGTLFKRFAKQGTLNSPWAIVDAPAGFGIGADRILVGNFGDGKINIFDSNGIYQGQLKDNGNVMAIDGLWALTFPEDGVPAGDQNQLFFTAGPQDENHGIFGYIAKR